MGSHFASAVLQLCLGCWLLCLALAVLQLCLEHLDDRRSRSPGALYWTYVVVLAALERGYTHRWDKLETPYRI